MFKALLHLAAAFAVAIVRLDMPAHSPFTALSLQESDRPPRR